MFLESLCVFTALSCVAGRALRAAVAHSGLSIKTAAAEMGLDAGQLSRQMDGLENISMNRVARLPVAVQQWFFLSALQEVGVPDVVATAQRAHVGEGA